LAPINTVTIGRCPSQCIQPQLLDNLGYDAKTLGGLGWNGSVNPENTEVRFYELQNISDRKTSLF
jgi:hypothetical protein